MHWCICTPCQAKPQTSTTTVNALLQPSGRLSARNSRSNLFFCLPWKHALCGGLISQFSPVPSTVKVPSDVFVAPVVQCADQVQEIALAPPKEVRQVIVDMYKGGYIQLQVPTVAFKCCNSRSKTTAARHRCLSTTRHQFIVLMHFAVGCGAVRVLVLCVDGCVACGGWSLCWLAEAVFVGVGWCAGAVGSRCSVRAGWLCRAVAWSRDCQSLLGSGVRSETNNRKQRKKILAGVMRALAEHSTRSRDLHPRCWSPAGCLELAGNRSLSSAQSPSMDGPIPFAIHSAAHRTRKRTCKQHACNTYFALSCSRGRVRNERRAHAE